jgi:hypothetical protein
MKKSIQAALSLGAADATVYTGIAIYRYPAHAAVVFAILTVFSLIGGASAWEVAHATFVFAAIVALIFITTLACQRTLVRCLFLVHGTADLHGDDSSRARLCGHAGCQRPS